MHKISAQQAAGFKTPSRRCIHPKSSDTWESIAQREMPDSPREDAIAQLQSWNLHVFARRVIDDSTGEMGNPILPSDLLFLEPPLVREA